MNASNKYSLPVGRSALERMDLTLLLTLASLKTQLTW